MTSEMPTCLTFVIACVLCAVILAWLKIGNSIAAKIKQGAIKAKAIRNQAQPGILFLRPGSGPTFIPWGPGAKGGGGGISDMTFSV
jgi:hypothetical protein